MPRALMTQEFMQNVKSIMKPDGVLALNCVGNMRGPLEAAGSVLVVIKRIMKTWKHVRVFTDEHHRASLHNYVLFASDRAERCQFRKATRADALGSQMRLDVLNGFEEREIKDAMALAEDYGAKNAAKERKMLESGEHASGVVHWKVMRKLFVHELWEYLL